MNKFYSYTFALGLVITSLASCSRSSYTFQPSASAYHTARTPVVTGVAQPVTALSVPTVDAQKQMVGVASIETPKLAVVGVASARRAAVHPTSMATVAKVAKPSLVKKVLLTNLTKKIKKHSNTASVSEQQASKAGRAGIVIGVGLILLLLATATGIGIIGLIGAIAFIVGLILLIIALING